MIQIQRPICPELAFRLVHDISPDTCSEDDDLDIEREREQFILSCLSDAKAYNNNNVVCKPLTTGTAIRAERISETYAKLENKEKHMEKINNQINQQHLSGVLEDINHYKNILNNNINTEQEISHSSDSSEESSESAQRRSSVKNDRELTVPSAKSHGASVVCVHKLPRRPRKLPEIPRKKKLAPLPPSQPIGVTAVNEKCLADELQEALFKKEIISDEDESDEVFLPNSRTVPKIYPKFSRKYIEDLKGLKFNTVSKNTRTFINSDNVYLQEDSVVGGKERSFSTSSRRERRDSSDGDSSRRKSLFSNPSANYKNLPVTHRGMHRFIPRHKDEMAIEIGDPIHVEKMGDDLWCDGINLKTNQRGIFPSMYATDLQFLEEDEEEDETSKFTLKFLGSIEVNYHKGDEILCQAINRVALARKSTLNSAPPPMCTLEINQFGIHMFDKSKDTHENSNAFTHFFALKNVSFCGHHPRNERYFGFITKHPHEYRYACHVFLGEKSTRSVSEAVGLAFKRFYQEYMAFTHPTEDIYME
ncbi:hypothetical protein ACJMK2_029996 [Sinanodonta woodiana]|uniref:JNK-interacting protein 1 n=1 Tax=Sinanodonta woodiana TaxID=1069815 RepID=A0ABD3XBW6_SINWO